MPWTCAFPLPCGFHLSRGKQTYFYDMNVQVSYVGGWYFCTLQIESCGPICFVIASVCLFVSLCRAYARGGFDAAYVVRSSSISGALCHRGGRWVKYVRPRIRTQEHACMQLFAIFALTASCDDIRIRKLGARMRTTALLLRRACAM